MFIIEPIFALGRKTMVKRVSFRKINMPLLSETRFVYVFGSVSDDTRFDLCLKIAVSFAD
ncbi:hypothetical protein TM49_20745 [Martelella endophytica]|uniref:Uncharacterized protein n=1 Tax=Martelella endophytica TaxID=1486262 RepID=A0A0D5LTM4_MAREN|nr:hypothetical protein TM49_20745 [Martelella endophytica]